MQALFLRLVAGALLTASPAACHVPERIHLSALIFGYSDDFNAVVDRLKHESFDALAASMPDNYAKDVGWFEPSQLRGSQYAKAADLPAGHYAIFDSQTQGRNITRVDEVRPAATCDDALRAYPTDAWALNARAAFEAAHGDPKAAIADYTQEIATASKPDNAYLGRAELRYAQGQYREALADVDRIALPSGDAYVVRANIETSMGDDDLAEADASRGYDQYHGMMRDEYWPDVAWGTAYGDLGYYKPAIEKFGKALALHHQDAFALTKRGYLRFASGDDAGAKADLLAAELSNPASEFPLMDLAAIHFVEGNLPAARYYAKRAHAVAPNDPYTALWLAIAEGHAYPYAPPRNPELETSLDTGIHDCESAFYRGITYYEQHRKALAIPLLRTAATTCPYREHERTIAQRLLHKQ